MEAALHAGSFLAAERHQPLSENSRLGHQLSTVALHPGIGFVNSNTATALRVCLYDDGRGSRCTGKERDSESGLDYFGARYYGVALGRWTTPDWGKNPEAVSYASFSNPQSLNLYSYVSNNPLRFNDPTGHHQECASDTWDSKTNTLTAGACHEVPDWWRFNGARRWIGNHPKTVNGVFLAINALTVASAFLDGGTSLGAVPEELAGEEALVEAGKEPRGSLSRLARERE